MDLSYSSFSLNFCRAGLLELKLFCLPRIVFISLLEDSFFLISNSFSTFRTLTLSIPSPSGLHGLWWEISSLIAVDLFYMMGHFLLLSRDSVSFFWHFDYHVPMYEFFWTHWASWICKLMYFFKFGQFSGIVSSNVVSLFFWDFYIIICLMVSRRSLKLYSVFLILFPLCSLKWIIWLDLSSSVLILSADCCWVLQVDFSFPLSCFSIPEFLFGSFL